MPTRGKSHNMQLQVCCKYYGASYRGEFGWSLATKRDFYSGDLLVAVAQDIPAAALVVYTVTTGGRTRRRHCTCVDGAGCCFAVPTTDALQAHGRGCSCTYKAHLRFSRLGDLSQLAGGKLGFSVTIADQEIWCEGRLCTSEWHDYGSGTERRIGGTS